MITREYNEADGIKIFDADIDESHTDYNAKGLDNLYSKKRSTSGLSLEKSLYYCTFKGT